MNIKIIFALLYSAICLPTCRLGDNSNQDTRIKSIEVKPTKITRKENLWVFILAGQSNMAGRGIVEPMDTIPSNRVYTINKDDEIILAKEPIHFYEPTMAGLDCGLSFGKKLLEEIPDSISIMLIPTAIGGSSISQWLGDSVHRNVSLLTNFNEKIELGKSLGQIKGILWHQGESDANDTDLPQYYSKLESLFSMFRESVGNEGLPILVGGLGSFATKEKKRNWILLNEVITQYSLTDRNIVYIITSDLKDNGDKIHFNSEGQRLLGHRFANSFIDM